MAKKNDIVKAEEAAIQSVEQIESLILSIRGKQVILDRDLARLYGVETFRLNEQVKRNIERFPEDFMFQLTKEEAEFSRSQNATLKGEYTHLTSQIAISSEDFLRSQIVTIETEDDFLRSQNATIENEDDFLRSQNATLNGEDMSSQIAITSKDATNMSSQFVTTSPQKRPKSAVPYAFTENGIAMLSSVLRSSHR